MVNWIAKNLISPQPELRIGHWTVQRNRCKLDDHARSKSNHALLLADAPAIIELARTEGAHVNAYLGDEI